MAILLPRSGSMLRLTSACANEIALAELTALPRQHTTWHQTSHGISPTLPYS